MMTEGFLGIDISKKTFDAALLVDQKIKGKKFNNNKSGFDKLLAWINSKKIVLSHVCMEATGVYGQSLAEFLYDKKIPVSVVNPARIKGFSQSELSRSKNDRLDAKLIARFCKLIRPALWKPTPKHIKVLQQWVRRLDDLIIMHRQEENRLEAADDCLHPYITKNITNLNQQIKEAKNFIKAHIHDNQDLSRNNKLLESIPGIGKITASHILAFINDVSKFNSAKEVAAFVGLNPKQKQSGTSIKGRTRLSKTGDSALRKSLYMPAIVAMRYNPIIKEFCLRLEKSGKHKMAIIGAVMRKLIHMIYGILKSGVEFDKNILKYS